MSKAEQVLEQTSVHVKSLTAKLSILSSMKTPSQSKKDKDMTKANTVFVCGCQLAPV